MRITLISDIHANYPALRAVLKRIDALESDYVLVLGDLIGYGPHPAEVVQEIKSRGYDCIVGNHDGVVTGHAGYNLFREPNQELLIKSVKLLDDDCKDWMKSMPLQKEGVNWHAVHASPFEPTHWHYLDNAMICKEALTLVDKDFLFIGHTHRPGVVANKFGVLNVRPGYKFVINPGSVGQPRDGDVRASFCTIDTEKFEHHHYRVSYDLEETLDSYEKIGFTREIGKRLLGVRRM